MSVQSGHVSSGVHSAACEAGPRQSDLETMELKRLQKFFSIMLPLNVGRVGFSLE